MKRYIIGTTGDLTTYDEEPAPIPNGRRVYLRWGGFGRPSFLVQDDGTCEIALSRGKRVVVRVVPPKLHRQIDDADAAVTHAAEALRRARAERQEVLAMVAARCEPFKPEKA